MPTFESSKEDSDVSSSTGTDLGRVAPGVDPVDSCGVPSVATQRRRLAGYVALLNLIGLAIAEIATDVLGVVWGAACFIALMVLTISLAGEMTLQRSRRYGEFHDPTQSPELRFYVAMALPPLMRLVMIATPIDEFSEIQRLGLIGLALAAAGWAVVRANGYSREDIGLTIRFSPLGLPVDLVTALSGILLGYLEYRTRQQDLLLDLSEPSRMVIAGLVLMLWVGFVEALLIRGLLQVATSALFGPLVGIAYTAALVAVMQIGYRSWREALLIIAVAILLGIGFQLSHSLLGVALAYGIANICLVAIFPLLPGSAGESFLEESRLRPSVASETSDGADSPNIGITEGEFQLADGAKGSSTSPVRPLGLAPALRRYHALASSSCISDVPMSKEHCCKPPGVMQAAM